MEENNMKNFLSELKGLLKKYNATIEVGYDDCGEYMAGGEYMAVSIPEIGEKKVCYGCVIKACDIKLDK